MTTRPDNFYVPQNVKKRKIMMDLAHPSRLKGQLGGHELFPIKDNSGRGGALAEKRRLGRPDHQTLSERERTQDAGALGAG